MKSLAKASRVNTALQVVQYMNEGMTVVDACREVGLPRSSYYDIVNKNPEAIAEYQELVEANTRDQLELILLSKTAILQKVIQDGLADTTKPRDRLHIYKTLNALFDDYATTLRVESQAEKDAQLFLREGPMIKRQVSRMAATTITYEEEN